MEHVLQENTILNVKMHCILTNVKIQNVIQCITWRFFVNICDIY